VTKQIKTAEKALEEAKSKQERNPNNRTEFTKYQKLIDEANATIKTLKTEDGELDTKITKANNDKSTYDKSYKEAEEARKAHAKEYGYKDSDFDPSGKTKPEMPKEEKK
jgi:chromosome segregation ATPase